MSERDVQEEFLAPEWCYFFSRQRGWAGRTVLIQEEPRARQCSGHCGQATSLLGNTHLPPLPASCLQHSTTSKSGPGLGRWSLRPVLRPKHKRDLENAGLACSASLERRGPQNPGKGSDIRPLGLWLLMITRAKAITICSCWLDFYWKQQLKSINTLFYSSLFSRVKALKIHILDPPHPKGHNCHKFRSDTPS